MKNTIVRNTLKVFAVGGAAAGLGAAAIVLACLAVAMYCNIPAASGYLAVGGFWLATLAAAAALAVVYMCGCWIIREGKFSR